jgi:hypothetical protein
MKKIYFLAGLPRTGNTLLTSILNQNPKISMSQNSLLCDIIYKLDQLKQTTTYKNFPNEFPLNNLIKKTFNIYYENNPADIIFDRGPWGTPDNLLLLKKYIENPKFIILNRPLDEIVASFMKVKKTNSSYETILNNLFDKENGKLTMDIWSVRNIIKTKTSHLKVEYDDLVSNTCDIINKIYNYFEIEPFKHRYENLDQISINNIIYDDSVLDFNLHTIRTNKIEKNKYSLEEYLPKEILEKLKNVKLYE